jgi:hypothetical protein
MVAYPTPKPASEMLATLIKILGMTTSDNDNTVLTAARAANAHLGRMQTNWSDLLNGKVTLIADPFTSIPEPPQAARAHGSGTPPPRPTPTAPTPPPRPQPAPPPPKPHVPTFKVNLYAGSCYHCGCKVRPNMGWAASTRYGGWQVQCQKDDSCLHDSSKRAPQAAPRSTGRRPPRPSTDDLAI